MPCPAPKDQTMRPVHTTKLTAETFDKFCSKGTTVPYLYRLRLPYGRIAPSDRVRPQLCIQRYGRTWDLDRGRIQLLYVSGFYAN